MNQQAKPKPIFKILSMKGVKEKASKVKSSTEVKKKITVTKKKLSPLEQKYQDIKLVNDFHTQGNSIREYLDTCHPDVNDFINTNKPIKYIAEAGKLSVVMANKFSIIIKTTGKYTRQVIIKDNKHKVVYNGESKAIVEEKKKTYEQNEKKSN